MPVITWLCSRVMRFQPRPTNCPLLTTGSPLAQWLEHPTRSRKVVSSNPIWESDFFRVLHTFDIILLLFHLKYQITATKCPASTHPAHIIMMLLVFIKCSFSLSGFLAGKIILSMIWAKFWIMISYDGVLIYSAELFPTVVR